MPYILDRNGSCGNLEKKNKKKYRTVWVHPPLGRHFAPLSFPLQITESTITSLVQYMLVCFNSSYPSHSSKSLERSALLGIVWDHLSNSFHVFCVSLCHDHFFLETNRSRTFYYAAHQLFIYIRVTIISLIFYVSSKNNLIIITTKIDLENDKKLFYYHHFHVSIPLNAHQILRSSVNFWTLNWEKSSLYLRSFSMLILAHQNFSVFSPYRQG